jgi:ribosomal protein RSM22 (predicted rRNA methylase)
MELPPALRQAVDAALEGISSGDLARASEALSSRYRAEVRDGRAHLADDLTARAYLAYRLPATFAAVRAAVEAVVDVRPDFAPRSLLDFGAGPGTALWAVRDAWQTLEAARLIEASPAIRLWGERLAPLAGAVIAWSADLDDAQGADLVTLCYVLDELDDATGAGLIERLWGLTEDTLLIVEPGTPAGWRRILKARDHLLAARAELVAPCPHARACPLTAPDWCHFSRRVSRSRVHLRTKGAEVPWEDEKFIYLAAARHPAAVTAARVLAPPRAGSGKVALKLCRADGSSDTTLFTRRDGDAFKRARRADWGDAF